MTPQIRLVYFADPMCSWCYGFSPVISALAEQFEDRLPLDLVMGGLRAGNTEPMRQQDEDYIHSAWTKVGTATGQAFDMDFFNREGSSTTPSRLPRGGHGAAADAAHGAAFMVRIQQAFYAENRDMTAPRRSPRWPRRRASTAPPSLRPWPARRRAMRRSATSSLPSRSASTAFRR